MVPACSELKVTFISIILKDAFSIDTSNYDMMQCTWYIYSHFSLA